MTGPRPPRRGLAGFAADIADRHRPTGTDPAPGPRPPAPAPEPGEAPPTGEVQPSGIRDALGLPDGATPDEVFAAFTATMDDADAEHAAALTAALPDGVVAVPRTEFERLRTEAGLPAEIAAQRDQRARASVIDAAIGRGAVAPAQREGYLRALAADFDTTAAALSALPNERAVPLAEVGHGQAHDTTETGDGWFDQTPPPRPQH